MWTKVTIDDSALIDRFVEIMRQMSSRLIGLDRVTVISGLGRRKGELHYYQGNGGELVVSFLHTPRRQSYFVCVGMTGAITPSDALELVIDCCFGFLEEHHLSVLYCIKRPMDYPPVEEVHQLVPCNPRVCLKVLEQSADSAVWSVERSSVSHAIL